MSNVKRPMSNVKFTCQITQRPNDQITQSIRQLVVGSFGRLTGEFDV
jgi:hypothetical protein